MLPVAEETSDLNMADEFGRGKRKRIILASSEDDSPPVTPPRKKDKRKWTTFDTSSAHACFVFFHVMHNISWLTFTIQ